MEIEYVVVLVKHLPCFQVVKKTGDHMLTAKAFNSRIICSWLADVLQNAAGHYDTDYDEGRLTLACVCMIFVWNIFFASKGM